MHISILFSSLLLFPLTTYAAPVWMTPTQLNDSNTKIEFVLDSTWHKIHGATAGVSGKVWLAKEDDPMSINTEITLPVNLFRTGNSSRDKRMREVMAEDRFNTVIVRSNKLESNCTPEKVSNSTSCDGFMFATLRIREIEGNIKLPYTIKLQSNGYEVQGQYTFQWADFGIEDPSILIARLDKDVTINFTTILPIKY